jgi:fibronectin type 3 domain-containing protein
VIDVQIGVNMALGTTPCTANIDGTGVCNVVVVQRVINAALGGTCVTGSGSSSHSVSLSWTPSTSWNVDGYNVYRGTTSGGPYTKLNSSLVTTPSYTDTTVVSGQTYYYVATALDTTNNESVYSNEAQAVVPSP